MDGGLDDEWEDATFIAELFRTADEAVASRNPNPTPTPTPAPAPIPTYGPFAATPVSYLPASSASYLPAASHPSSPLRFSPPPELSQRPPLPPPTAAVRDFSPPRELSQRQAPEEGSLAIVAASGSAGDHRFVGTGVGAKRDREARELERLKRELNRVSKQMNELKNECTELRKDRTKKDLQIKAKEAEIQNLEKANVSSSKDVCSAGMDIDQSFHAPANGALHAGGSCRTSTRRTDKMNGRDKDVHSLRDDLYLKQGQQTDLAEALELRCRTMIDNGISTSGVVSLEENTHFEPRSITCKEIKAIGVQTDKTSDNEHLECNKVLVERISSNLRAMWGMSPNSLSRRNLISKIIVSCSEEILSLLQCTRLSDNCEPSSEASSSMNEAISQVYDMFIKMNSGKISIQTFLEALLNLCAFDTAAIVGRTLRVLRRVLQHLLHHGAMSSGRNNVSVEPYVNIHMENNHKDCSTLLSPLDTEDSLRQHNMFLPFTLWSSLFTAMLQIGVKYSEETIRTDALSIMILIVRSTDPKEERHKFGFTSVMTRLHLLLQKENGLLVKKHSVRLLFLLLNCPVMLKLLCSGGKDGSEQMESEACENNRSQEVISSVLADLSDCLTSEATCSLGIELCRLVIILLAYIASSGKLGYDVLLGPVSTRGASFLEMIMEVLASQMQYETQELLKERCLVMREALILLNRLASHTSYSKPTLEVLTRSKICATLTIDVANRLPQTRMANDLAELAQKFRSRVYAFLEEKPLTVEGSNLSASNKS
ncbi:protein SENSITIVE TO UV 2-like isoform X1 [Miscanthus floridulus]|uniref:protein SENSITIVE TO UV 2-like isoform X1 n=1 Tax=Miscanthus floridulus TaxID=154761 RepID=UPI00345B423A